MLIVKIDTKMPIFVVFITVPSKKRFRKLLKKEENDSVEETAKFRNFMFGDVKNSFSSK